MITHPNQLLYSKGAIASYLGVQLHQIKRFQIWHKVVWVSVWGERPSLISKRKLREWFAERRQVAARKLQVYHWDNPHMFSVVNDASHSRYQVDLFPQIRCACEDFRNQQNLIGKACCKHVYAVLHSLGYGTLSDWMEREQWAA